MHGQSATPKPLVDELLELKDWGRDLRIDACRGIALWWIFLDHIPNNIGSWLTPRNYGFSDAAEVFMFISGVTCALAYGKAWRCEGWTGVIGRTLRRSWDIYVEFLLLTLASAILVHVVAEQPLGLQADGLAVAGCAWRVVDHRGQQGPAVGEVTRGACPCSPLSALQPDHRTERAHQAAGSTDPANAGTSALPIGQIESRPLATAAFPGHSRFGGMVGSSQLASAEDARDARRDPLRPELATYLLHWRFAGSR